MVDRGGYEMAASGTRKLHAVLEKLTIVFRVGSTIGRAQSILLIRVYLSLKVEIQTKLQGFR